MGKTATNTQESALHILPEESAPNALPSSYSVDDDGWCTITSNAEGNKAGFDFDYRVDGDISKCMMVLDDGPCGRTFSSLGDLNIHQHGHLTAIMGNPKAEDKQTRPNELPLSYRLDDHGWRCMIEVHGGPCGRVYSALYHLERRHRREHEYECYFSPNCPQDAL
ncbi:uncharacterized protein BO95DRAFT_435439 [Aspergillus brunneoviolaceus CBS 621.78]|uniref:Uncharacterized protein n=1 Tax=Aspergillus brunneoviolaceus CBS 621.78 TaxID=1450534 RepID=A0ACD1FXX9_9EURO|nr:hypothetical protein BO95DRAFT_435439 [Aspergillus brunneoviolaceus CBS 621.78]RAH41855.1 hypothetical protein BO95DRAFT_435439 [Aspergillus brunneoviolaceus CBS 621.78]